MFGQAVGSEGVDEDFADRLMDGLGAFINPPYRAATFILTHHPREPIVMEVGTTFHFVTVGIHVTLERPREAAR